jgi:oligoendopeptidase F
MTFEDLKPRFQALEKADLSPSRVEAWMLEWSGLTEDIKEEGAWLYIRCACDTRDKAAEEAQQAFQVDLIPKVQESTQALKVKLLDSGLKPAGLEQFLRGIQADREIYRQENLKLAAEVAGLDLEHAKIAGAQTVEFEGKERTLQQMGPYLEQPDRALRERAWRLVAQRRANDSEKLDQLFDALLPLRVQQAKNAGFDSYVPYRFKEFNRLDYGPEDALRMHAAVLEAFAPLVRKKEIWKARDLGLACLRPWDAAFDSWSASPLKPFEDAAELVQGVRRIYARLDPEPAEMLEGLRKRNLLDLDSRIGKGPGGFNYSFPKSKGSFIFWSSAGMQRDVMVLLHEGGHAYQGKLCESLPLVFQREIPMEFAELASMGMEMLGLAHLGEFYEPRDAQRARLNYLWSLADGLCRIVAIDAFQHRVYGSPGMSASERHAAFAELDARSGSRMDFSGLEDYRARSWHGVLHIFRFPFYYVEYAFAQLGALQVWEASLGDPAAAFAGFKRGLALGGTRPLPQLYRASGVEFNPTAARLKSLAATLESEINTSLALLGKQGLPAGA